MLTSKLSKYLTGFDYADKILTVFLTAFSGTNIFAHVIADEENKEFFWLKMIDIQNGLGIKDMP